MNYRFIRVPQEVSIESYDTAAERITKHASGFSEVEGVYRMGSVTAPGISDLDMLVVIKHQAPIPQFQFHSGLSRDEQYALMHGVFVVTQEFWENRDLFFTFDNLKLLWGEFTMARPVSPSWKRWAAVRTAILHVLRTYYSAWIQRTSGIVRTRGLLCELYALRYDESVLSPSLTEGIQREFTLLTSQIDNLRKEWFNDIAGSRGRLLDILKRVGPFFERVVEELARNAVLSFGRARTESHTSDRVVWRVSQGRVVVPTDGTLTCKQSGLTRFMSVLGSLVPVGDLAVNTRNRLSSYEMLVPRTVFEYITDNAWILVAGERNAFIEQRLNILQAHQWGNIRSAGHAVPVLDLHQTS